MSRLELRVELIERGLRELLGQLEALKRDIAAEPGPLSVAAAVCAALGAQVEAVVAGAKTRGPTRARHACALAMHRRGMSYSEIADVLGMGDHSTAIGAVRSARKLAGMLPEVARAVEIGESVPGPTREPRKAFVSGLRHGHAPLFLSCLCKRCKAARRRSEGQAVRLQPEAQPATAA